MSRGKPRGKAAPWELERGGDISPLRTAVKAWMVFSGSDHRLRETEVILKWVELVGEGIARVATPASMKKGLLKVKVENPSWKNELQYLKEEIMNRINARLGGEIVKEIRLL